MKNDQPLTDKPTALELHRMAMEEVGKGLQAAGFEFLAVNSDLKKDPQFVCTKDKQLYFIVVKGCAYPEHPKKYDLSRMEKVKAHAVEHQAVLRYAGVGFAHARDYEIPLTKNEAYVVNYDGLQPVLI